MENTNNKSLPPKKQKKQTLSISISADIRHMVCRQAEEKGLSVSEYVERIVLEREVEAGRKMFI